MGSDITCTGPTLSFLLLAIAIIPTLAFWGWILYDTGYDRGCREGDRRVDRLLGLEDDDAD